MRFLTFIFALLLTGMTLFVPFMRSSAQETVIWQENFERSSTLPPAWRNMSQSPNVWILNDLYESRVGASTPLQPKEITGGPSSRYLHITQEKARTQNAIYDPVTETTSEITSPRISTTGYTGVQLNLWMLCNGMKSEKGGDFGTVLLSINGKEFVPITDNLMGIANWKRLTFPTRPGMLDNATIQFKFVWRNDADGEGGMPSFSIDELTLTGSSVQSGVVISETSTRSVCQGTPFQISYLGFSDYQLNNAFIAELSDASGNFDKPTEIGRFTSQLKQGTIFCTIPETVPQGSYRLRIRSTRPDETSSNTVTVNISELPLPGRATAVIDTVCEGNPGTLMLENFRGIITWEKSVDGINFLALPGTDLPFFSTDPITQTTWFRARVVSGACPPAFSNIVQIFVGASIFEGTPQAVPGQICSPTPVTLTLEDVTPGAVIQWQQSNTPNPDEFTDIPNGNTAVFTTEPLMMTTYFRALVYNKVCAAPKITFTVEVNFGLRLFCNHEPQNPLPGEEVTFTLIGTNAPDQKTEVTFFAGDDSAPKTFTVEVFPFVFTHTYTKPITAEYRIEAKTNSGCEGTCGGVVPVQNQSIRITGLNVPPYFCPNFSGTIYFETKGEFEKGNTFVAEISDARGSFDGAIDMTTSVGKDSVSFTVPTERLERGSNYNVRVRSTAPVTYSTIISGITVFGPIEPGTVSVSQEVLCSPGKVVLAVKGQEDLVGFVWEKSVDEGKTFIPMDESAGIPIFETEELTANTTFRLKLFRLGFGETCDPAYSEPLSVKIGMPVVCTYAPTPAKTDVPTIFTVNIGNDPGPYLLDVQFGDGETATYESITTNPFTFRHTYKAAGEFEYSVKVKGKICAGSCQQKISVEKNTFRVRIASINPKKLAFCEGETLTVEARSSGLLTRSGKWTVELSDAAGSFETPIYTRTQPGSDSIFNFSVIIPRLAAAGDRYRFRVRTEAPEAISEVSAAAYSLKNLAPKPEIEVSPDGKSLRVKNSAAGTYQWYLKDMGTPVGSGVAYTPGQSGQYRVIHTSNGLCDGISDYYTFTLVSAPVKKLSETQIKVYPNPVKNDFEVVMNLSAASAELHLYNMMGQRIQSKKVLTSEGKIEENFDLSDRPSGIYFLKVIAGGKEHIVKIVKQ